MPPAAAGLNGLMDPVEPGLACGSDTAHLSLFGYDPRTHYRGRGAFESMGAGLAMDPGDIAFKCNFATLDPATGVVVRRRADRRFEELGPQLCAALDGLRLPSFPQVQAQERPLLPAGFACPATLLRRAATVPLFAASACSPGLVAVGILGACFVVVTGALCPALLPAARRERQVRHRAPMRRGGAWPRAHRPDQWD